MCVGVCIGSDNARFGPAYINGRVPSIIFCPRAGKQTYRRWTEISGEKAALCRWEGVRWGGVGSLGLLERYDFPKLCEKILFARFLRFIVPLKWE